MCGENEFTSTGEVRKDAGENNLPNHLRGWDELDCQWIGQIEIRRSRLDEPTLAGGLRAHLPQCRKRVGCVLHCFSFGAGLGALEYGGFSGWQLGSGMVLNAGNGSFVDLLQVCVDHDVIHYTGITRGKQYGG